MKKKKTSVIKKVEVTESVNQPNKKRTRLLTVGIIALVSIGAIGAMNERSKTNFLSNIAEKVGLKQKETQPPESNQPQTAPQLSKEYVYAGSRMLATEDYGIAQPNPTPTP